MSSVTNLVHRPPSYWSAIFLWASIVLSLLATLSLTCAFLYARKLGILEWYHYPYFIDSDSLRFCSNYFCSDAPHGPWSYVTLWHLPETGFICMSFAAATAFLSFTFHPQWKACILTVTNVLCALFFVVVFVGLVD